MEFDNKDNESTMNTSGESPTSGYGGFLSDKSSFEISMEFTEFSKQNRVLIVPIGFPQAGKSLMLSSLMFYGRQANDALFRFNIMNQYPFNQGRIVVDEMIKYFNEGELYAANKKGTLDLIGIDIEPAKKGLPILKLGFLDLAGEDIKKIKTSEGATFTDSIDAVFNGIKIDNSPIIFLLITPFSPPRKDNETQMDAHSREDTLHYDFLNYIKQDQPQILKSAKFFIVVSQWDLNQDEKLTVEEFIQQNRPSIYGYVKNSSVVWGEYSVGKLLVSKNEQGLVTQKIIRKNYEYPSRFWKKLYSICTGKDLDQKKWWEKILG
jgi:hypothetical protein